MELFVFYIIVAICAALAYKNRRKIEFGVLTTEQGKKYPYTMGDYIKGEDSSFNGMEVTLPYTLTNFYLDSHKDSKRKGPAALYDKSQTVSLEGNFNNFFQLFVPPDSTVFVLSVLSPDVMQTLINSSQRFDVELYEDRLRIISVEKTSKKSQKPLLTAAKAIIDELDHRAKSWKQGNTVAKKLRYQKGSSVKFARFYFRKSRVITSVLGILAFIVVAGFGLMLYYTIQDPNFSDPFSKGIVPGILFYAAQTIVSVAILIVMFSPFVWLLRNKDNDIFS